MTCADVSVDELVQTVYLKIKQMKRELTLTDIAGYLPYGLKVQEAYQDIWTIRQLGNIDPCRDGDVGLVSSAGNYEQYTYIADIRPILRPMSDLAGSITHKGKTFIPIECIAEMTREDGNDSNWTYDLINWFGKYDPIWSTSELLMSLPEWLIISVIDKLCEWMFDYRGLIYEGLAVSVRDLQQNPYEK